MSYFPMFVELQNKKCLVVGGGSVALRKIRVLLEFGAQVTAVAPDFLTEVRELPGVVFLQREFEAKDLSGMQLVVAATDRKEWNHRIAELCKAEKIPCNAVDQIEDCTFIFPSYVKEGEVVAAFSSGGTSPVITQYLKEEMKPHLSGTIGNLAACLGSLRAEVKSTVPTEAERKRCYREILELGLEWDDVPTEQEIREILVKYQRW